MPSTPPDLDVAIAMNAKGNLEHIVNQQKLAWGDNGQDIARDETQKKYLKEKGLVQLEFPTSSPRGVRDGEQMEHQIQIDCFSSAGQRGRTTGSIFGSSDAGAKMGTNPDGHKPTAYQYGGTILMQNAQTFNTTSTHNWNEQSGITFNPFAPGSFSGAREAVGVSGYGKTDNAILGGLSGLLSGLAHTTSDNFVPGNATLNAGEVIDPKLGIVYSQSGLREHQFIFPMFAKNEADVIMIDKIITMMRYLSAPDRITLGSDNGGFDLHTLSLPHLFTITHLFQGNPSHHIPRIGISACTSVSTTFNPSQVWATFKNGAPIETTLTLSFKEMSAIDKEDIMAGY